MKLKEMSKEDLESYSYDELAQIILEEKNSKMKITDIFKKICQLLKLSDTEFENKIADFYELISTDKDFIILEKGFCDLRKKHTPTVIIEEDEEVDNDVVDDELKDDKTEEKEDDIFYDSSSDEDDVEDSDEDELTDFIVEGEEETGS